MWNSIPEIKLMSKKNQNQNQNPTTNNYLSPFSNPDQPITSLSD